MGVLVAGKTLSQKNAESLKAAFFSIGKVLAQAKIIDAKSIDQLESIASNLEDEDASMDTEIAASSYTSLIDEIETRIWNASLDTICYAFLEKIRMIFDMSEMFLAKSGKSKTECAQEALTDFIVLIERQFASPPPISTERMMMYLSSKEKEGDSSDTEPTQITVSLSAQVLEAESGELDVDIEAASANCFPIKGVLFKIDQPSEGIPAVGPGLPLYIPMEVAIAAVKDVNGLPLDADPSLSKHANDNIDGVIQSAEICGDDFVVHGQLWPFNKPEKVQIIAQNISKLGMSMNANATGRAAKVNGREVFKAETLNILGANILYSEKATFQQTSLVSPIAASTSDQIIHSIAASSADLNNPENPTLTEGNEMDPQVIYAQIQSMSKTLEEAVSAHQDEITDLRSQVSDLVSVVTTFQNERRANEMQIQAQQREEQEQQREKRLIEAVVAAVAQKIPSTRDRMVVSQPPRLTTPIAASGTGAPAIQNPLEIELIQAEAKLSALRESGANNAMRLKLIEDIKLLRGQLNTQNLQH